MLEKRFRIDTCVADLQMAQSVLESLSKTKTASEEQIYEAAVHAKRLEVKLAAAKLAQTEYYLSSLVARIDYLKARCARQDAATRREMEELEWARGALPINTATVERLTRELEHLKRELKSMLAQEATATSAA